MKQTQVLEHWIRCKINNALCVRECVLAMQNMPDKNSGTYS